MLTYASLLEPIRPTSPPPVLADQQDGSPVCDHCEKIASNFRETPGYLERGEHIRRVEYVRHDYYPDFPNLRTSAERGCACCALLRYTIRTNWSLRPFTEHGIGDLDDSTPLYANFLATEWDGQVCIDDLRFTTSSTVAEQVTFLTVSIGPSAYGKNKGFRVIEQYGNDIDTLDQISAEFVLKVYKPARSSHLPSTCHGR
jgi:hypothetical protein